MFHQNMIVYVSHSLLKHLKSLQVAEQSEADHPAPISKFYSPSSCLMMASGFPGCCFAMTHKRKHPPGISYEPDVFSFPVFT